MLRKLVINTFQQPLEVFYKKTFQAFSSFSIGILIAFIGVWVSYIGYKAIVDGKFDLEAVIKKILLFSTLLILLSTNNSIFHNYAYEPIKETTNGLVSAALSINSKGKPISSAEAGVDEMEGQYKKLWEIVGAVNEKANFGVALVAGLISFVIFLLFMVGEAIYALYVISNSMKLAAIGALSPFLIVAFAFNQTRGHAIGALKYLLNSVLTLIVASFFVGMILTSLQEVQNGLNVSSVTSADVISMLSVLYVVALVSIYFLLIAPELASAISGAQSGSILTGIVATGITAGLGFISSKLGGGVLAGGKLTAGGIWAGIKSLPKLGNAVVNPQQTAANIAKSVRSMFANNYNPTNKP